MDKKKNKKAEKKAEKQEEVILASEETIVKEKKDHSTIVLPVILILALVGSIIGTIVTTKYILPPESAQAQSAPTSTGKISEDQVIVPLEEFVVNLAKEEKGSEQYIRVTLSILVANEKESEELQKNMALVRDSVVNVLRQKKAEDILNAEDGVKNLKKELQDVINEAYGKMIIQEVYVTDFVIQ